jgi:chlorophyll synthase
MAAMALSPVCAARVAPVASSRQARVSARLRSAGPAGRVVLGARRSTARLTTGARTSAFRVAAAAEDAASKAEGKKGKENEESGSNFRQLLGIRGGEQTTDIWKIRLQLTKPVTWVPLIWGVMCGAAASGHYEWNLDNVGKALLCMFMSGPLLTGYTQTINDWEDREIDAINEPNRPIPSGAISEFDVQVQIYVLLFGGWAAAWTLDQWCEHDFPIVTLLVLFGSWISYIYSAPPLKLKQEGWRGNYALGASYIALPWWAGQAVFGELSLDVMVLTVLYSIAGLGIAIVNDFKSIEGDRTMGLMSLPVAFGVEKAKWICVGSIDATQLAVAGYLRLIGEVGYSNVLLALIFPQIFFQFKFFLPDPVKNDVKYQASAQPFLVFGLLTTGLAWGHHINAIGA